MMCRLRGYDVAGESGVTVSSLTMKKKHFKDDNRIFKCPCSLSTKMSFTAKFRVFFYVYSL